MQKKTRPSLPLLICAINGQQMDNITKYNLASLTFTLLMQLPILELSASHIIF